MGRVEPSPKNWRTHDAGQKERMRGLLGAVGSVSELVVWVPDDAAREALRRLPGPDGFAAWIAGFSGNVRVIDGHMRRGMRGKKIGVQITDLDEREAGIVLATFDPIGAQAGRDEKLLRELLVPQKEPSVEEMFAELRASLSGPEQQRKRKGKREDERSVAGFVVLVDCDSDDHQLEVIERLMSEGLRCRALT